MSHQPRFELLVKLGEGGMGEVWLARMHLALGSEIVALKRIRPELARRPTYARDFEREARLTSLLHHPNVVNVRRYGVDAQGPYLALEFVAGRSADEVLSQLQAQGQRLPLPAALCIARDAARGLAWAHAFKDDALQVSQVLHRDISPENLLVAYDGLTRVADFGLARAEGKPQAGGASGRRGKFGFMAPELYLGREADVRSDVFSFGATLFELLTGQPAFHGSTDAEVSDAVQHQAPPRPSEVASGVPEALDFWVERALAKDPLDRPVNLDEVLLHLERLLKGEPGEGREAVAAVMLSLFPPGTDQRRAVLTQAASSDEATVLKLTALPVHDLPASPPPARRWWLPAGAAVLALAAVGAWGALALHARLNRHDEAGGATALADDGASASRQEGAGGTSGLGGADATGPAAAVPGGDADGTGFTGVAPDGGASEAASAGPAPGADAPAATGVPQGQGALRVQAPDGAKVYVDKKLVGTSPLEALALPPGTHLVTALGPRGGRAQKKVLVRAGESAEVRLTPKGRR